MRAVFSLRAGAPGARGFARRAKPTVDIRNHCARQPPCCLLANRGREHGGMTSSQLPGQPNLEQLKKQAKNLLHAARAGDPDARRRLAALPGLLGRSAAELAALPFALHDAQSAIAREYGFPSWN